MKIYFTSQSFYPHIGGVSTYLLNLEQELKKKGYDITELHLRPSNTPNSEVIEGIRVHRVPKEPLDKEMLKGYSTFKEAIYKECHDYKGAFSKTAIEMEGYDEFVQINDAFGQEVREMLNSNPADIVHIHDFQLIYLYRYVPRGTPLILTWHIPLSTKISKPLKKFLLKHLIHYDKIIFSTQDYIVAAVNMGLPVDRCELIYPLCNTTLFRKKEIDRKNVLARYGIPSEGKIILCVQRIDQKSGHEQLIRTLPQVLRKVADAVLVFVGSESMSNQISTARQVYQDRVHALIKELRVSEKVIFTGNIDYRELPDVYNAADIVALCSRTEGFGLSITEGMSCGKPIIGTNAGGIPLQVKDKENGFLVERGDSDATADRIITLLEDEQLRKRFGEKSQEIVDMHFKLEAGIDKHIHLYKEVMKEKDEARCLEKMNIEQVSALITDFDRTLTDTPGVVKKQTIEKLKELDTIHILATGRVLAYVQELAKKYSLWDCIVCENGAVIYFPDSKKTIAVDSAYMKEARALVSAQIKEAMVGMVIISVPRTAEEKVKHLLKNTSKHLNYVYNVDEMMILPKFINKGSGVAMALDYLGIEADQTIVVGDGENDLDMFRTPGFNVAVANAHPKLKLISDQITKNPASAGVEEIAEKLLSD